jgi:hypothetical protein
VVGGDRDEGSHSIDSNPRPRGGKATNEMDAISQVSKAYRHGDVHGTIEHWNDRSGGAVLHILESAGRELDQARCHGLARPSALDLISPIISQI